MTDIRTYLAEGNTLLFDGAMGTYYAGLHGPELCEMANLWHSDDILSIHRAYLDAGCQAIKTNTFAAGVDLLGSSGGVAREMIKAACGIAWEAVRDRNAWVFASIGPAVDEDTAAESYQAQAELFMAQGLTCFLAETLGSDSGVKELASYIKERNPNAFLIVSYAVNAEGLSRYGYTAQELLDRTAELPGVDALGFNCGAGPGYLLRVLRQVRLPEKPLSVMPNAGYPSVQGRQVVYKGSPAYFGEKLAQIAKEGASIVGGCCGTTPKHIAAVAAALERLREKPETTAPEPEKPHPVPEARTAPETAQPPSTPEPGPAPERRPAVTVHPPETAAPEEQAATPEQAALRQSAGDAVHRESFGEKLDAEKRVLAVEFDPPADDDAAAFLDGARALWAGGADAVTIADSPVGRPRADSSLLACKLKREFGIEPLPHIACRDRNLNATKALLLGLSMEGVHNVLLVTGDPIPAEMRDEVKGVFNFNSRTLARYVRNLNEQVLKTPFRVFGALNLNSRNFVNQLKIAYEKEDSGISGFLTQPVLSKEAYHNLRLARDTLKGKILAGIFPVVSYRNACFLNNEIAGMRVADEITALYEGKSREDGEKLAEEISVRIAGEALNYADGLYLMTPFRRVALMGRILAGIRENSSL